ncbi:[FeFe] hydrogenase H-cluster maturation GTPase HydF [Lutibacter sp. B2]|nr:[FeFe] hydrogenase H-cluster maturation GTPase HydF [Lutibacter sp. B2]
MNTTPNANRLHISIFGKTNAGKSSLFNTIIGQDLSIVSSVKGTTTDPVSKAMEFLPFGPVVWLDTAGLKDTGELGKLRMEKTLQIVNRTDFALYIIDSSNPDLDEYKKMALTFKKHNIPHMVVCNKKDLINDTQRESLIKSIPNSVFVSVKDSNSILMLKDLLLEKLQKQEEEKPILGDLIPYGGNVILVVPIDSEAPKGRIILPQVQVIRDCLDHGIKTYVVRDTELEDALHELSKVDLVITDSQAFKEVSKIVPVSIPLTSFSILFARYKGDLNVFLDGISAIEHLDEHSKILISESCTHNHSHEDIGRVKIPRMLRNHTGKDLKFDFKMGHDFPSEDLSKYDLIIHCGSCMLTPKTMKTRISLCEESGTNITNYGMVLAYSTGILPRSIEIFLKEGL